jgi:hypothetical protein
MMIIHLLGFKALCDNPELAIRVGNYFVKVPIIFYK